MRKEAKVEQMKPTKKITIRPACSDDATSMAKLIDIAGEGIPNLLWSKMAEPGQLALDVGRERACREMGGFSYRNALVAESEGSVVGMMLGYIVPQPDDEEIHGLAELPDLVRPFVELEHQSVGTFYINALAVFPGLRGSGIGSQLLAAAEQRAGELGATFMSIQFFAQNEDAGKLYRRIGYEFIAKTPVLSHPCQPYYTGDVELLMKPI